jgi:predicted phosphoribosyltransferase
VVERRELRGRARVFRDRDHAGEVVAEMLLGLRGSQALLLAIPAGGVSVAATLAGALGLDLDVAVVSKITLPWNSEAGYGAVAFDGTVRINRSLAAAVGLEESDIAAGVERTQARVQRRVRRLREDRPWPALGDRTTVLVDDGLASGFTMLCAIDALRGHGANHLLVAVPTGPEDTVERVAERVEAVYCANVRASRPFAVASAYEFWCDVSEDTAIAQLQAAARKRR